MGDSSSTKTSISVIPDVGDALKSAAEAAVTLIPGREIVSRYHACQKAERILTDAVDELTKEAKRRSWSEDYLTFRIQSLYESMGRTANVGVIAEFARQSLGGDKEVDEDTFAPVDSEWLNYFIDHAERVTSEDAQRVWGSVLAGEVNQPGSYSKMAMHVLSLMDKQLADTFRDVCRFAANGSYGAFLALIADDGGGSYNDGVIQYEQLSELSSVGLVDLSAMAYVSPRATGMYALASDGTTRVLMGNCHEPSCTLAFAPALTQAGRELSNLCKERDVAGIKSVLERAREEMRFSVEIRREV